MMGSKVHWASYFEAASHDALLLSHLLEQVMKSEFPILRWDLRVLNEELERCGRLMDVYLNGVQPPPSRRIKDVFQKWVKGLWFWLERLFQVKASPKDILYDVVAQKLSKMVHQLGLSGVVEPKFLRDWYEAGANHWQGEAYLIEAYTGSQARSKLGTVAHYASGGWWRKINYSLKPVLEADLRQLWRFGEYCFKSAVCYSDEQEMLGAYIKAYERVQAEVKKWKGRVFEARKQIERQLREEGDYFYLSNLTALDGVLRGVVEKIEAHEAGWLKAAEEVGMFHQESIKGANTCLRVLQSPAVKRLRACEWIHRSCHDFRSTEGLMLKEMILRNQKSGMKQFEVPEQYDREEAYIENVHTMTDFSVMQFSEWDRMAKKELLKLHPDKVGPGSLEGVAAFATDTVVALRKKYERFVLMWKKGQWFDMNFAEEVFSPTEVVDEREPFKFTALEAPEGGWMWGHFYVYTMLI